MTLTPLRARRRFPLYLWGWLHEPKLVTAAAVVGYLGLAVAGVMSLIHPPNTITLEVGPYLTFAGAGFAVFGGLVGLVAAPRGLWWLERVALLSVLTYILIYGTTIISLQITSPGSRWMQIGLVVWGAQAVLSRWDRTRGAALDPTKGAPRTARLPPAQREMKDG